MIRRLFGSREKRDLETVDSRPCDEIVVLATPRSGTNYFCECLTEFNEVRGFYEIFNPAAVMGAGKRVVPLLNQELDLAATDARDKDLVRTFRRQPSRALDALAVAGRGLGGSIISYKVFPRQLQMDDLAGLFKDDRRRVVFIVRSRLDVYISYQKAQQTNVWTKKSTAEFLPEIKTDDFLEWADGVDAWYSACLGHVEEARLRCCIAQYEKDINIPKSDFLPHLQGALGNLDLEVSIRENALKRNRYVRQDRMVDPFAKVANGAELRDALRSQGKYKYALERPLEAEATRFPFRPNQVSSSS